MENTCKFTTSEFLKGKDKPGLLLWELANLWQKRMRVELENYDLTHVQFFLLKGLETLCQKQDFITQKDLSEFTHIDIMMTSTVLRSLEAKKLIERFPHPTDSRANYLKISKKGMQTLKTSSESVKKLSTKFFKSKDIDYEVFINSIKMLLARNS
jgi:DNA-binding MarR family transcriptional regulator